jgi:glycine cleavage system aminomethyltransferase T
VQGPRSRELLQRLTSADLSNEAFPFRAARELDIGFARVLCMRITYLGELGYELYIPTEQAVHVYDRMVRGRRAGRAAARGPQGAGLAAHGEGVPRLRPRHRQHRHRARGGLGFAVDLKKPGGFIGKEAVLAKKAAGPLKRAWCRCW